jgi:hypothetical protein
MYEKMVVEMPLYPFQILMNYPGLENKDRHPELKRKHSSDE